MPTFLHAGCGPKHKDKTVAAFRSDNWKVIRLAIDPSVNPDIVGSTLDMSVVKSATMDAVFSSQSSKAAMRRWLLRLK